MRKPHCTEQALLKRRDVIKGGAVVLASAFFPFSIEILNAGSAVAAPPAPSGTGEERILWNSCNVNCGSRCALRVHVKDGVITRVETDNTGDDRYGMQQLRACPRGRSMRQRIYAEQRIPYPLRRVGNRGEGKFERISWEEAYTMGVYKRYFPENHIAYKAFRDDPEANPLPSPSGKIEIYSPRLAELAETWTLLPGQAITALPEYIPNPEGAISPERKEWPLQLIGHHYKQRTHSTYGNCWWLQEVAPQELWINPIDAKARGIEFGDRVKVFNGRGVSFVKAKITPRIMPGVVSLPEGAWHTPNAAGEDTNGCVNVLTKLLPTALAKGNPHHTNLVQVEKA